MENERLCRYGHAEQFAGCEDCPYVHGPHKDGYQHNPPSSPLTPDQRDREAAELLPCPFCGQDDAVSAPSHDEESEEAGPVFWSVGCGCTAYVGPWSTEAEAIAAWNTRALARPAAATVAGEDFLRQLRRMNSERYHAWVGDGEDAGIMFDALELGGEVGELLNVVKKLEREERGWRGSRAAPQDFADECADVLICLDKLARRHHVNLIEATIAKFNATSAKVGLPHTLTARAEAAEAKAAEQAREVERLSKDRDAAIRWANQSVEMLQDAFFPVADALRDLEAYLRNTPHHNAVEAAAARKALRAFDEAASGERRSAWTALVDALKRIDAEASTKPVPDHPTVGFPASRDPEQDDGNDTVREAFDEGVAYGLWLAADIARATLARAATGKEG